MKKQVCLGSGFIPNSALSVMITGSKHELDKPIRMIQTQKPAKLSTKVLARTAKKKPTKEMMVKFTILSLAAKTPNSKRPAACATPKKVIINAQEDSEIP